MLTQKEAFLRVIQAGIDDGTAELALTEAGISPAAQFVKGDLKALEIAAIPVLQSLLTVSSESEGSLSESRSREGIKDRLLFLAKKHGLKDVVDAVSGVPKITSVKWR